ncbi:hypothetical protein [Chroogloeocystis siderophila]|jgi:hypothetical protein|uniref:Uncharacterized protein n=1 Tax=Chroogloeocystis siderophila 5.2 s.c.1 TaxID=247279 RepID=A0A1U7HS38_9CHRO|nr:hypothetical protein [Chroogloeocystis siderophila]OKH26387.1 hypothetical protein NIES1031_11575 [Chroogloeocystis siderophila 5.2 s.c.1]
MNSQLKVPNLETKVKSVSKLTVVMLVTESLKANACVIECWFWNVNPTAANAKQFPGWLYRLPFTQV